MAILGFPSSAIIGDLNWTGSSSFLNGTGSFGWTVLNDLTINSGDGSGWTINGECAVVATGNLNLGGADTITVSGDYGATLQSSLGPVEVQAFSGNVNITTSGGYSINLGSRVNLPALTKINNSTVATQPFAIAAAVALG